MPLFSSDVHYLDFHTHSQRYPDRKDIKEIISVHLGQDKSYEYFTIGLHPWWADQPITEEQRAQLSLLLFNENCLAMGEMGLDNLKGPEMNVQKNVFRSQLSLASEFQKPVVIHCVRAFDQLIKIKREFPLIRNWCVHGYGRHTTLAKQLIDQGFYLSIMPQKDILRYKTYFDELPNDRLFLETDSMSGVAIEDIYLQVSGVCNIDITTLQNQLIDNAKAFFQL